MQEGVTFHETWMRHGRGGTEVERLPVVQVL